MTWLLFLYAFTLGAEQTNMLAPEMQWYGYSRFEASVMIFNTLEIGGAPTIYFQHAAGPWFAPVEGDFPVFARLHFKNLTVEAAHLCIHGFYGGSRERERMGHNRLTLTLSNRGDR
jgi:hypothetical protein